MIGQAEFCQSPESSSSPAQARTPIFVASAVFLLVIYMPVASVGLSGLAESLRVLTATFASASVESSTPPATAPLDSRAVDVALRFLAGDAFYYLTVARQSRWPVFTYDGTYPTNGFHPLWQHVLTLSFSVLKSDQRAELIFALGFSSLAVALGAALASVVFYRAAESIPLAIVAAVPGVYALAMAPFFPQHSTWSSINGMEACLSVLFFGCLSYWLLGQRCTPRLTSSADLYRLSALLTLLTLSRLDDIFLFMPFLALVMLVAGNQPAAERAKRLARATAIPTLVIGGYLLHNLQYTGLLLPGSGVQKLDLAVFENTRILAQVFVPGWQGIASAGGREWYSLSWRALQIFVPAGVCGYWLMRHRSMLATTIRQARAADTIGPNSVRTLVLAALAAYVVLKAGFSFVAVEMWSQGAWYFPASLMLTSLFSVLMLSDTHPPEGRVGTAPARLEVVRIVCSCLFVFGLANFSADSLRGNQFDSRIRLWHARERISREVASRYGGKGLLEFADGILGYSLSIPSMSGIGFTLDKEALEAKANGSLLDLAYRRGFRAFSSLNYFQLPSADDNDALKVQQAAEAFFLLDGQGPERWDFRVLYRDPDSQAVFVSFSPKRGG